MDTTREQLKTLNSQFTFFMKQKVAAKPNLISLLDNTYPGVNKLFDSPTRDDGSEKWVDYAYSFWHVDCVRKIGLKAFTERYEAFCKKHHYNYRKISQPYYSRNPNNLLQCSQRKNLTNSLFSKAFNSCVWYRNTSKSFVKK